MVEASGQFAEATGAFDRRHGPMSEVGRQCPPDCCRIRFDCGLITIICLWNRYFMDFIKDANDGWVEAGRANWAVWDDSAVVMESIRSKYRPSGHLTSPQRHPFRLQSNTSSTIPKSFPLKQTRPLEIKAENRNKRMLLRCAALHYDSM